MADLPMRPVAPERVGEREAPGAFCWVTDDEGRRIIYACPRGQWCAVPIHPNALPSGASWRWDGNEETPTLTPSINCVGGCRWHGFITAGRMTNG